MSIKWTPRLAGWINKFLRTRTGLGIFLQASISAAALVFAWALRFEFTFPHRRLLWASLPVLLLLRVASFYRFHLDHGYWRFSGIADAFNIVKAVLVSSLSFFIIIRYALQLVAFPLSVYASEVILSTFGLGAIRITVRAVLAMRDRSRVSAERPRTVIVGAGFAGQLLLRELKSRSATHMAVALVDDDRSKTGAMLHGTLVAGTVQELSRVIEKYQAEEVLIAVPSATREQLFRIVEICQAAKIRYRAVPSLRDLASGKLKINEFCEIDLESLLEREAIALDLEPLRRVLRENVVMVTGAAGSIGSELCCQILSFGPKLLICVDHDETALFNLEHRLAAKGSRTRILYFVEDVGDTERMRDLLLHNHVDFVFHAAAYKHVPMMERNPRRALRNNVFALRRFVDAAEACGVAGFLLISSDKAVNPTNVMGCTKRIGELILSAKQNRRMRCVSVRFGNVLGSQGSVIPLFQQQLRDHKPVTITHPDITRFFMTISEAVSLVLQAFTIGQHGEILVLDMGEPISILRMAKALIRLSGYEEREVPIMYTGLRPGEKLYEELFYASEKQIRTGCEKVLRTQGKILKWSDLERKLHHLERQLTVARDDELKHLMSEIVPEYLNSRSPLMPKEYSEYLPAKARSAAVGFD